MSESVVLCEGYHDRAFWTGLLERVGCTNPARQGEEKQKIRDFWKRPVTGGHYLFHSRSGRHVRVQPCDGRSKIRPAIETRLRDRDDRPLRRLIVCVDSDWDVTHGAEENPLTCRSMQDLFQKFGKVATQSERELILENADGQTIVTLTCWKTPDALSVGIPPKQTLERLLCAAMAAAYPDRAPAVDKWLQSRPQPCPPADHKAHNWSYMAGWYADSGGGDAYFERVWRDPLVAEQIEKRLRAIGLWQVAEQLAE